MSSVNGVPINGMVLSGYKGTMLVPVIDTTLPVDSQNGTILVSAINLVANSEVFYDIGIFVPGSPYNSGQLLLEVGYSRGITYGSNFSPSAAVCTAPPASGLLLAIENNGELVGTISFSAGSTLGSFSSISSSTTFSPGNVLTIIAPSTVDPNFANVSITFSGLKE